MQLQTHNNQQEKVTKIKTDEIEMDDGKGEFDLLAWVTNTQ
jgi:hypothetical protein